MRKLLNTLYVTSPDSYLSLDGENVVIYDNDTASPADCVSPTAALFGVQPASMEMPKTAARRPAAARRAKPVIVWLS